MLSEVVDKPEITQRELSQKVGIALGLTNVMLRNLVQKGYIRATNASWKRWLYTLTPEGFSHKIRLTVAYINRVLDHYQRVRRILMEQLESLPLHKESRVAICGTGELAELVYLGLKEIGVEEIDIFDLEPASAKKFLGLNVRNTADLQPEDYDRIVVASLEGGMSTLQALSDDVLATEKVVTFFGDGVAREVK